MLFPEKYKEKNKIIQNDSAKIDNGKYSAFCFSCIFKHEKQYIGCGNSQGNIDDCLRYIEIPFEFLFFQSKIRSSLQTVRKVRLHPSVYRKIYPTISTSFQTVIQINGWQSSSSHSKTAFMTFSGTEMQPSVGVLPQCMNIADGFSVSGSYVL